MDPTPEEFGDLFAAHAHSVYAYCFQRTGDWALAEDLTSIVFLEAWKRRGAVDLSTRDPRPWLLGVAVNVLHNQRRSLRRHRAALERFAAPAPANDFAADADARIDDERRMRELLDSIRDLPDGEREVLALVAWADLSYEETAAALGVPVGTVRSRLSRARGRLARMSPAAHATLTEGAPA